MRIGGIRYEPLLAMVALIAVGLALVWKPRVGFELETGAWAHAVEIAGVKGVIVTSVGADDVHTHRLLLRDGTDLVWQDGRNVTMEKAWQLAGTDPKAGNTWEDPNALTAQPITAPVVKDGKATIQLPPLSFTVLTTRDA